MSTFAQDEVWRSRLETIDSKFDHLRLPNGSAVDDDVDQDQEWCEVVVDGKTRRIRFHDYGKVYEIPGLYEEIFYERLKCCSPYRVATLLEEVIRDFDVEPEELRVLDVGAGNGMVGDQLAHEGVETIYGIDLLEEAKMAAERDRPGLYQDYFATDLTDLPESIEETLRRGRLNCLTSVAALGFGDIPPLAFINAMELIRTPGWLAFNIKESFLRAEDESGFDRLVRHMIREELIQVQAYRRYQHRISITGEPLHYVAMVATKQCDIPRELIEQYGGKV